MKTLHPLLGAWRAMHNRCYKQANKSYAAYGGRGIAVDAAWHGAAGFKQFVLDMGLRPAGLTLERINNDGNYSLSNCRWASYKEQSKNKRNNRFLTANGVTKTLAEWAVDLNCSPATILYRLKSGMSEQNSVTTPVQQRPNSTLSVEDVHFVVLNYPMLSCQAIADKVKISKKAVLNILHGKTYKDITKKLSIKAG